ncbi:MarC family protein [Methylobacter psychrophilus]|uniref:MarC family protein n=1 Tax=Methylobacter psychrophilus TaxID=96941 RepID=UPI00374DFCB1
MSLFLFFGSYILKLFGISIPVVQFSGGIVLALMGWQLLNQKGGSKPVSKKDLNHPDFSIKPHAFYPFTFSLTVDTGRMTVA